MHKAALASLHLPGTYDLIDCPPQHLAGIVAQLRTSYQGFNVTIPHKQAIMPLLDELTMEARIVRAVNTVKVEKSGKMIGHNTDTEGFLTSLKATAGSGFIFPCVCLIGSGGAARAALWSVTRIGAQQVVIVARTLREARSMKDEITEQSRSAPQIVLRSPGEALNTQAPTLIVNCTPIGLSGDATPAWITSIMQSALRGPRTPVFFDMVYSRSNEPTPLVKQALAMGLKACDGLQMLVEQAAASFEFFTGLKVTSAVMSSALAQQESSSSSSSKNR
jgi:shikimate dehydrogenase